MSNPMSSPMSSHHQKADERKHRLLRRTLAVLPFAVAGLALACSADEEASREVAFSATQDFLPGFEHDTGFVPADSPAALRVVARAQGGTQIDALVNTDGASMEPVPGSGSLTTSGEIVLEVSARVDAAGFSYEGVVDSFSYAIDPAMTTFDPFLLDAQAVVEAELPAAELARVPIPSIPGSTLIVAVSGGTLATTFEGVCAESIDGAGQYLGRTTTSGSIELEGSVEIDVPIVGTETFGPFPITVPVPELVSDVDLGSLSLTTGERIEGVMPCVDGVAVDTDGAGGGGGGPGDDSTSGSGSDGPGGGETGDPTTAGSSTGGPEDGGSTTDPGAGDGGSTGGFDQEACDMCWVDSQTPEGECADSWNSCWMDAECNALIGCINECADEACLAACQEQYPDALGLFGALVGCIEAVCQDVC